MTSLFSLAIVLVVLNVLKIASCDNKPREFKVCGTNLANALAFVCNNVYQKRSDFIPISDEEPSDYAFNNYDTFMDFGAYNGRYPFRMSRRNVASMLKNVRTKRDDGPAVGIVDECCRKSCKWEEMKEYCGSG